MRTTIKFVSHTVLSFLMTIAVGFSSESRQIAPPDRLVRIFFLGNYSDGATVPASALNTILFLKEPCPLDLADTRGMFRAWMALGSHQLGCWYPTVSDTYVTIDGFGNPHSSDVYWESLPHAQLHADGSATITEPGFVDMGSFMSRVSNDKVLKAASSHRNDRP